MVFKNRLSVAYRYALFDEKLFFQQLDSYNAGISFFVINHKNNGF